MTPKPLPESSVLAPQDPSVTNPDDWPEFRLSDVSITLPGSNSNEPLSLLLASEHHPVKVTGKLEPLPKDLAHSFLLPSKQKLSSIEIPKVRSFAYGAYEDGSVEIWAAGNAGWFAISPSRTYRRTYDEMIEGIKILYFIADAYRTPRRREKGKTELSDYTAREIFKQYAQEFMESGAGPSDAAATIYKHREFLIQCMLSGKEGMAWSGCPMYKHLSKKFPKDFMRIRQRLDRPAAQVQDSEPLLQPPSAPVSATLYVRQPSLDLASTTSSLKRKRGRPPKRAPTDIVSIGSSSVASSTAKGEPNNASKCMDNGTRVTKDTTKETDDLTKAKTVPTAAPKVIPRRGQRTKISLPASAMITPEVQESQPEASAQDSESDAGPHLAHRGKSALRLKPSKSSKGPPRTGKLPIHGEHEDAEPRSSPLPARKRKRDDPPLNTRGRRRRSSRHEVDEGIDMPTSPSSEELADSPDSDAAAGAIDNSLPLRLNHQVDPIQEDTWVCALDGCTHKVYSASLPESQHLIREHYALHAYDDDERVQMVKKLQAPSLPVNHLMEKVRMQAKVEGFPGSRVAGTRFPEPLKQRY